MKTLTTKTIEKRFNKLHREFDEFMAIHHKLKRELQAGCPHERTRTTRSYTYCLCYDKILIEPYYGDILVELCEEIQ